MPQILSFDINDIACRHFDWVRRMGWHNKTVLEALALIYSEIGEAANECRGPVPTPELGSELADIVLRTADLAQWQQVDIASWLERSPSLPTPQTSVSPLGSIAAIGQAVGAAVAADPQGPRGEDPSTREQFALALSHVIYMVDQLAQKAGIDLGAAIVAKMTVNEARGTRGRHI